MDIQKSKILLAAGGTAVVLVLWILFSPWGMFRYFRLQRDMAETRSRNIELTDANNRMQNEITRLKSDPAYLEKVARDMGMLRDGEVVFQTPPPKPKEKH